MHGAQHAGDKLVDAVALGDQGHQGRDAALVVAHAPEVREDELLELVDLVLQGHEVGDGLVALVGVVDGFQGDVLLVLEGAVELRVLLVEGQLGEQVVDVLLDEGPVAAHALAGHAAVEAVDPAAVGDGLAQGDGVALLEDLVDGDEGLEGLDLVGEDGLAGAEPRISGGEKEEGERSRGNRG
ncbi:hypothetical protein VTK73DRAFT_3704 [Phialemonium thermophilum]|uniref:Uncharacterized protein n=1 Tax=Phialemonium thermophilum TaxID=223376 RepID=A0ABR3VGU2_9PEZI